MRADVFRRSGRSAPDCSREVGPDGAAATGRRMPRTETIDSTFSLSRVQSRTCSGYAEARKRRMKFNETDMSQKIRIKLKSFDHNLVDKSAEKIVKTVKSTGAVVSGPVPLPTQKKIFTVNRSTFVNKKAREQFQLCTFKRILDIYSSTAKTIDALMKLELPSGVEVEIKV